MTITSRERLAATLNHTQPDRLCVDFGAGGQTGVSAANVRRLRQAITGDTDPSVRIVEPFQMLGDLGEDLQRALALDVVGIPTPSDMFGLRAEGTTTLELTDGTRALMSGGFRYKVDDQGRTFTFPLGDTSCEPSAMMPAGGCFFDAITRGHTTDEKQLDPALNCEDFGLLTAEDLNYYNERANHYRENTDYGLYMTVGGLGFGDIALVPATWMKTPRGIRDLQEWYISPLIRPDYIHAVFQKQLEFGLANIEQLAATLGDKVQVAFVSGADFGTQNGLFISRDSYREFYLPYHKAVCEKIHDLTSWKTFIHSCGGVYDLIPDFIEAGFDILNPVQCSAKGMSAKDLKREYGREIVFWGGGIDTQKTLPFGTPDEVYREARERIDIFAPGGGFVFNAIHNIQGDVPIENLLALFRALHDARGIDTDRLCP